MKQGRQIKGVKGVGRTFWNVQGTARGGECQTASKGEEKVRLKTCRTGPLGGFSSEWNEPLKGLAQRCDPIQFTSQQDHSSCCAENRVRQSWSQSKETRKEGGYCTHLGKRWWWLRLWSIMGQAVWDLLCIFNIYMFYYLMPQTDVNMILPLSGSANRASQCLTYPESLASRRQM